MSEMDLGQMLRSYARPTGEHVSLGAGVRTVLWLLLMVPVGWVLYLGARANPAEAPRAVLLGVVAALAWRVVVSGVRVAAQWERGVVLRLGRFMGVRGPGIIYVIPIIDYVRFVDTRTLVLNIPRQKVITRDNVPAEIDGALFFLVKDAERAITSIQDYRFAIAQYAQATLRDIVGGLSLDELLTEREQIQLQIGASVEARIREWGLHVDAIRLQDIELPEELKRMMSRQASAEREKRATITKAEGDKLAAVNLADAAATMQRSPGAMQLRALQSVDSLGASPSNTVLLFPVELANIAHLLQRPEPPAE